MPKKYTIEAVEFISEGRRYASSFEGEHHETKIAYGNSEVVIANIEIMRFYNHRVCVCLN